MKVDLDKQDLVNLVLSTNPKSMQECDNLTKVGLMEFCGNQWNEDWKWKKEILNSMIENDLWEIYKKYK